MSRFRIREIRIDNFRCFDEVRLPLEEDTTVLFAENGGGKTALLTALAMGLAMFQRGPPKGPRDRRKTRPQSAHTRDGTGRREPVGPCKLAWTAAVGESDSVTWSVKAHPAFGRSTTHCHPILDALKRIRVPGSRWPLFAWYGVDRMARSRGKRGRVERTPDRWEAYASALDPNLDEAPLLQWLQDEMLGDIIRRQQNEPERSFHAAVMDATVRATPGVTNAWYDPATQGPVVRFENGYVAPWSELSDGHRVFIGLVADMPVAPSCSTIRWRRRGGKCGRGGAYRQARPPPRPTLAARGSSARSQHFPKTTTHRPHALTAGSEQCREPPSTPALRREASGTPCSSRAGTRTRSCASTCALRTVALRVPTHCGRFTITSTGVTARKPRGSTRSCLLVGATSTPS